MFYCWWWYSGWLFFVSGRGGGRRPSTAPRKTGTLGLGEPVYRTTGRWRDLFGTQGDRGYVTLGTGRAFGSPTSLRVRGCRGCRVRLQVQEKFEEKGQVVHYIAQARLPRPHAGSSSWWTNRTALVLFVLLGSVLGLCRALSLSQSLLNTSISIYTYIYIHVHGVSVFVLFGDSQSSLRDCPYNLHTVAVTFSDSVP